MRIKTASPEHEIAYQDICALVNKHANKMTPLELLTIAANMVGKLIALQDQRTTSTELAMETVIRNLESGNQQVIDQISQSKGSA